MTKRETEPGAARMERCSRPDLLEELADFAEAAPARRRELSAHAASCPECGPRLEELERAESWIAARLAPKSPPVCPSAEELYDYGRGPGAQRLSEPERLSIRAHVSACNDCTALVQSLAHHPPAPLLFDETPDELPRQLGRRRRMRVLIPLAAAATIAAVALWLGSDDTARAVEREVEAGARVRFPGDPLLRGEAPSDLWYPRDRVLRDEHALYSALSFEMAPRERASAYRVILRRVLSGAFEEGFEVGRWSSASPAIEAGAAAAALEAGHYTWEAWAVVDGLDVLLGQRDFEVRQDAGLVAQLALRAAASEPARSESMLHLLHAEGYAGDARALARTLPPSAARDAYLARRPAR